MFPAPNASADGRKASTTITTRIQVNVDWEIAMIMPCPRRTIPKKPSYVCRFVDEVTKNRQAPEQVYSGVRRQ